MIYEDVMLVVVNCTNPGRTLQDKSMTLSYHFLREHSYGCVEEIRKIGANGNVLDTLTKGLDSSRFKNCAMSVMSS